MSRQAGQPQANVAIACGGTGGHFFPGMAVGQALAARGASIMLLASEKSVDRTNALGLPEAQIEFLPSVGLVGKRVLAFTWGVFRSLMKCSRLFWRWRPDIVLVMGGFTSVAPALVGRFFGARVYLHEANAVPGRANRWLARLSHGVFVGFEAAAEGFNHACVTVTGTPVREAFLKPAEPETAESLGLSSEAPILLVMGGSQGALAINQLMLDVVPSLAKARPDLQVIHLTGGKDQDRIETLYRDLGIRHYVKAFETDTANLVRIATAVVSRAGASSIAEYAAVRLPAFLIPYPQAVDNHQSRNADQLVSSGAAVALEQEALQVPQVVSVLDGLLFDDSVRSALSAALAQWDAGRCAGRIADALLSQTGARSVAVPAVANEHRSVSSDRSEHPGTNQSLIQQGVTHL